MKKTSAGLKPAEFINEEIFKTIMVKPYMIGVFL